jgi:hypothetical protein
MSLEPIADELWRATGPDLRVAPGFYLPVSATVIRLPDRSLVVYSPPAFDDATAAAIDALGEVAHVIASSLFHHMFATDALTRWPHATLHAPRTLARTRPDLAIARFLDDNDPDPAWQGSLDVHLIRGAPRADETVLLHRPTGSLICADLFFHVPRAPTLLSRIILSVDGAGGGRLAQGHLWRLLRKDRAAARASVDHLLTWPIRRIVPCHGEPALIDSRPTLAAKMSPLYGGRVPAALDTEHRPD